MSHLLFTGRSNHADRSSLMHKAHTNCCVHAGWGLVTSCWLVAKLTAFRKPSPNKLEFKHSRQLKGCNSRRVITIIVLQAEHLSPRLSLDGCGYGCLLAFFFFLNACLIFNDVIALKKVLNLIKVSHQINWSAESQANPPDDLCLLK